MLSRYAIVEPSGGASGQASDIAIHAKEILRVREALTGIYQRHCAHEGEEVKTGMRRFGMFITFWSLLLTYADDLPQRKLWNVIIS